MRFVGALRTRRATSSPRSGASSKVARANLKRGLNGMNVVGPTETDPTERTLKIQRNRPNTTTAAAPTPPAAISHGNVGPSSDLNLPVVKRHAIRAPPAKTTAPLTEPSAAHCHSLALLQTKDALRATSR